MQCCELSELKRYCTNEGRMVKVIVVKHDETILTMHLIVLLVEFKVNLVFGFLFRS